MSYTGCTVTKPAKQECRVSGDKVTFNTLKGKSPETPETLLPEVKLVPSTGWLLSTFSLTGCKTPSMNNPNYMEGTLPVEIDNGRSLMITHWDKTYKSLEVNGTPAWIGGASLITSEGKKPVKLDTAP